MERMDVKSSIECNSNDQFERWVMRLIKEGIKFRAVQVAGRIEVFYDANKKEEVEGR